MRLLFRLLSLAALFLYLYVLQLYVPAFEGVSSHLTAALFQLVAVLLLILSLLNPHLPQRLVSAVFGSALIVTLAIFVGVQSATWWAVCQMMALPLCSVVCTVHSFTSKPVGHTNTDKTTPREVLPAPVLVADGKRRWPDEEIHRIAQTLHLWQRQQQIDLPKNLSRRKMMEIVNRAFRISIGSDTAKRVLEEYRCISAIKKAS